jgi:hypothetical protein
MYCTCFTAFTCESYKYSFENKYLYVSLETPPFQQLVEQACNEEQIWGHLGMIHNATL